MMDPIVINIEPPRRRLRLPKFPHVSERASKLISITAAVIICISMVIFVVASALTNNSRFQKNHLGNATPVSGSTLSSAAQPGGATSLGTGGTSSNTSPVVTISATPSSVIIGGHSHLTWSTTKNPTSCTASDDWSGNQPPSGSTDTPVLSKLQTYMFTLTCKNAGGTGFATVSVGATSQGSTGGNGHPVVTIASKPSAVLVGENSTLIWSSTNATSCTASDDWSGNQPVSGAVNTAILTAAKQYTYTLTCKNSIGSGYARATVVATTPPANLPIVTITSSAIGNVKPGSSATLTWSTDNNPTSCIASGDWSGSRPLSGSASVGPFSTIKTYSYTLTCSNAAGISFSNVTIQVIPPPPVVTLTASPTSVILGGSATLTWSSTNNPTSCTASGDWSGSKAASGSTNTGTFSSAGPQTFTLTCSNSAGSGSSSTPLTVIATPVINFVISPTSINVGSSATLTWSVTNNPTSCSAGGSWSGSKAASGSQVVTPSPAGSYLYSLSCANSGGTTSASKTLAVNTVTTTYCNGQTPCYGPKDLTQHATVGNCWGYNLTWVIDITSFAPHHKGGTKTGSLESPSATCAHDIHAILAGTATIPGYTDSGGSAKHGHNSSTVNNTSSSTLSTYVKGYYDASKP